MKAIRSDWTFKGIILADRGNQPNTEKVVLYVLIAIRGSSLIPIILP